MLRIARNRPATILLLAIYALSTTAAGLFHDHSHPAGHVHDLAGHAHPLAADCSHDDDHDAAAASATAYRDVQHSGHGAAGEHVACFADSAGASQAAADSEPSSDDGCAVCRFLGLNSLPTALLPLQVARDAVAVIHPAAPRQAALPLVGLLHSRAPPQLV